MSLNLFPARIEIGVFKDTNGKDTKVYQSPEFARALSDLLTRVGGALGLDGPSLATLASFTPEPTPPTLVPPVDVVSNEVAQLREALQFAEAQRDAAQSFACDFDQRIAALEMQLQPVGTGTDWEHPGKLGDKKPNTAKITVANLDPSNAATVLLPALYFVTDTTTGFYRPALNNVALSVSGLLVATWSATGALYEQNVSTKKQLISSVAIGTPPLVVTSTTQVPNLYVARAALADNATTANALTSPTAYPANATDLPTAIALVNALKAANTAKGV